MEDVGIDNARQRKLFLQKKYEMLPSYRKQENKDYLNMVTSGGKYNDLKNKTKNKTQAPRLTSSLKGAYTIKNNNKNNNNKRSR